MLFRVLLLAFALPLFVSAQVSDPAGQVALIARFLKSAARGDRRFCSQPSKMRVWRGGKLVARAG
jgi:hypothetical protein